MTSFIKKYKPSILKELIGNKKGINEAKKWIKTFISNKKNKIIEKRALLIIGPPGIGKTTFAHILLEEYGFIPIEFNASVVRTAKLVREQMSKIINTKNILIMMDSKKKSGIIMDEIDGCINGDKGGIKQIIKMIYVKKSKKSKNTKNTKNTKITTPIICICNDEKKKKISELKKHCKYIKFNYPSEYDMKKFIRKIIKLENINITEYCVHLLYKHCQNDIRRVLYLLEVIKSVIDNDYNNEEKLIKVQDVLNNFGKKNVDLNLFTITEKILGTKKLLPQDIINYIENDILLVPLIIHENLPIYLDKNYLGDETDKISSLDKYYDYMKTYCEFEKYIYKTQEWKLSDYICLLNGMATRNTLKKFKKSPNRKINDIKFTSLLNRNSQKYLNLKNLKYISKKLGISPDSFNYYSEIILQKILDQNKIDETCEYLKSKGIEKKDFDKFIKLNTMSDIWIDKISPKLKKYIGQRLT